MGAQQSYHEPLNTGGIPPASGSSSGAGPVVPSGGPAPDFNRSEFNNSHRMPKKKSSLASKALNPRNTIRKSLRRRREKKARKKDQHFDGDYQGKVEGPDSGPVPKGVGMDRLRRSFRDSFKKKKDGGLAETSKPYLWQQDEKSVRAANCAFPVKYLGCVEVFESRGMQVCEEALKVLRASSRRRPIRGMLHVSGDGLRVVDDETKGLIVDQTIEKVSFCAPDRNHERGFSYICRDGTTRRWMCHGFVAVKETGERLSHAVGCAFAACLERKQKRDKECGVTMTFDQNNSTFTRMGSFKQMSITERLTDPQECKPSDNNGLTSPTAITNKSSANPHAIARPHATPLMLQRQGSCRAFQHLNQSSPFKRQLSLRLNDLPSNMERQRSHSLTNNSNIFDNVASEDNSAVTGSSNTAALAGLQFPADSYNNNGSAFPSHKTGSEMTRSKTTNFIMTSIPEDPSANDDDPVKAMCQQLSQGLSMLSSTDSNSSSTQLHQSSLPPFNTRPVSPKVASSILVPTVEPIREDEPWSNTSSKAEEWLAQINAAPNRLNGSTSPGRRNPPLSQLRSNSLGSPHNGAAAAAPPVISHDPSKLTHQQSLQQPSTTLFWPSQQPLVPVPIAPTVPAVQPSQPATKDPFEFSIPIQQPVVNPNNPFLPSNNSVTKTFEVQM